MTPYAGLIYDIDDTWSAYASYTSIFQPSGQRDVNSEFLDPTTGKAYEAGLKADWFNTRLTASLAVFRIEQDNVALNTGVIIPAPAGRRLINPLMAPSVKGLSLS